MHRSYSKAHSEQKGKARWVIEVAWWTDVKCDWVKREDDVRD